MHQSQLLGFTVLTHARAKYQLNWEVRDILRTAGRQAAGYLALLEVNIQLASARQFEAFNRLSAFVVHDLKNVVAQLSLVESNAQAHKNNPEFIDDVVTTIANATQKMNRLLVQLRSPQTASKSVSRVNLSAIIEQVVKHRSGSTPIPEFNTDDDEITVLADKDRLASIIEHLVQNAQEATENDGFVRLRLYTQEKQAKIDIEDNGAGMNEKFIRDKLFRPFVTTKGNAGMGIGVYEAREVARELGGTIEVESQPGKGTKFTLTIPVSGNNGIGPIEN
jgi:putative PEP-CTERM system histidine kinase